MMCKINKTLPCTHTPTAVTFLNCDNLTVDNLRIKNAPQMHLMFQRCLNVKASRLVVTAPRHSPNTDGIHVTETQNIHIQNCIIGTGDDCISIVSGSENVEATDINCGPGHGIRQLGISNSSCFACMNIIKTWQALVVEVSNIGYKNILGVNASEEAINFKCSKSFPCREIWLEDVNLVGQEDESVKVSCENVELINQGNVSLSC